MPSFRAGQKRHNSEMPEAGAAPGRFLLNLRQVIFAGPEILFDFSAAIVYNTLVFTMTVILASG